MDLTEMFHNLVSQYRPTAKPASYRLNRNPNGKSGSQSFVDVATHVMTEVLQVKRTVLTESEGYITKMSYGQPVDDRLLTRTESLVSGAARHVDQLQKLIGAASASTPMSPQQLCYFHGTVACLYELLQDCTAPFGVVQSSNRSLSRQWAKFEKGDCSFDFDSMQTAASSPTTISHPTPHKQNKQITTASTVGPTFDELSDQQLSILEQENQELQTYLTGLMENVKQVEKTAVSLSALASMFASKVEEQNAQIEEIYSNAQQSTDYVRMAVKQISQATRRGLSFRFYVLIALTVFSAVLLVLDSIFP